MKPPSLKRVLISVMLMGIGIGIAAYMIQFRKPVFESPLAVGLLLSCGTFVGAGAFNLFKQSGIGATIGTALWGGYWLIIGWEWVVRAFSGR